jgi:hypothetical protein
MCEGIHVAGTTHPMLGPSTFTRLDPNRELNIHSPTIHPLSKEHKNIKLNIQRRRR